MFPFIKFLKIVLPVATVTSATIATTFLVSSSRDDLLNKEGEEDSKLTDFANLNEDFQEKKLFYAKQGDGDGTVALGEKESQKLQELLNRGVDISKLGERPDSVPIEIGSQSQSSDAQSKDDEVSRELSTPKGNVDSGSSVVIKSPLTTQVNSDSDPSETLDSSDAGLTGEEDSGENKVGEKETNMNSDEDVKQKTQTLNEEDNMKKENDDPSMGQSGKVSLNSEPQLKESEKNTQEGQPEGNLPSAETPGLESKNDSPSSSGPDLEGRKNEKLDMLSKDEERIGDGLGKEMEGNSNKLQDSGHGNLLGNSDETKFNLEELRKLEGELGSAQSALNVILSEL